MTTIDINCDMGESFGRWTLGSDAEVMPYISSANVACGGHAGDPNVMAATVRLAKSHGVAVGAHPGYADLAGFGRRYLPMLEDEVRNMLLAQIGALHAIARAEGYELSHIKPHGALYNEAMRDADLARHVVGAIRAFSQSLPVYCLPGSEVERAAHESGLTAVLEGFADRAGGIGELGQHRLPDDSRFRPLRQRDRQGAAPERDLDPLVAHGRSPASV